MHIKLIETQPDPSCPGHYIFRQEGSATEWHAYRDEKDSWTVFTAALGTFQGKSSALAAIEKAIAG